VDHDRADGLLTCDAAHLSYAGDGEGTRQLRQGGRPTVVPDLTLDALTIPLDGILAPIRAAGAGASRRLRRL